MKAPTVIRRAGTVLLAASTVALGLLALPAQAWATLGAGVGASPLTVTAPTHPGHTYTVTPNLLVVNTGTDPAYYRLRVQRLSKGRAATLPAGWVRFAANDLSLAPNAQRSVIVQVSVPGSALPGSYTSDVVATGVVPHATGQAAAGAAAATTLSITVIGSPATPFPWFILVVIIGLLVVVGVVWLIRRSGVRLKVERR